MDPPALRGPWEPRETVVPLEEGPRRGRPTTSQLDTGKDEDLVDPLQTPVSSSEGPTTQRCPHEGVPSVLL